VILVTGGSGFFGRHLVRHLSAEGRKVRALYNSRKPDGALAALPGVTWQTADLLDVYDVEAVMQGVTDVYHCAAIVSFDPRKREEMLYFNPESTTNVVNQALEQGVRKLVFVSSVSALGRGGEQAEINEDAEWGESKYNSAYALSKYLAEMEVWRGIGEGLCAGIVNPGIMLGEGDWAASSAQLIKLAWDEFPFYTKGVTSWVDVRDVVNAAVMLMDSDIEAERFIVSAGNFAFRDIFTMMAGSLNKRPPRYYANPLLTGIARRWHGVKSSLSGTQATITKETARNAHGFSFYNNSKLIKALPGFAYTPMEETIGQMARSFINSYKK
jgi:nucleoside-diphosphate-sugar epimerase